MSDAKYFQTTKRGEMAEYKDELQSKDVNKKREAVKKVIAAMTVGKDVSALFTDVLNCIQTNNMELKKLVYLYLMNYAKSQPQLAILAVNTFVKDAQDPNPLIRALAVRTMGCIRVPEMTEYLCEPLRKCLKDKDPYVKKTAVICVAKLYDMNAELVKDQGFLVMLNELLADANPMVVANAVATLAEISQYEPDALHITTVVLNKLLTAVNECTEWGQVFILDSLVAYEPADAREAKQIIERVLPRLQHANPAVVLSAVKVCLTLLPKVSGDTEMVTKVHKKLTPPLITLVTTPVPEIQYVALRSISIIVNVTPEVFAGEVQRFVCKYFDPVYVKLEKLEIIVELANAENIDQILPELKEYASEVDVEFVRRSVRAIGKCAIKLPSAARRCVGVLIELVKGRVSHVVQECVIVMRDVFRAYPNQYESVIGVLCENLESLDNPEAKAAMIWIIGEYSGRIDNAPELLETFLETFTDETTEVQLQLLTSIVMAFLYKPETMQEMVQQVLQLATQETDSPDLRDRGYMYWRLLSADPEAAKRVVLAKKPPISGQDKANSKLMRSLVPEIAMLASVYQKPASQFVSQLKPGESMAVRKVALGYEDEEPVEIPRSGEERSEGPRVKDEHELTPQQPSEGQPNLLDLDDEEPSPYPAAAAPSASGDLLVDLMGLSVGQQPPKPVPAATPVVPVQPAARVSGLEDMMSISNAPVLSTPKKVVLTADKGRGLTIESNFVRRQGRLYMDWTMSNKALVALDGFAVQLNKNSFGITLAAALNVPGQLLPNKSIQVSLPLTTGGGVQLMSPLTNIQIAVKDNVGVFYFADQIPVYMLFIEGRSVEKTEYLTTWKEIPEEQEKSVIVTVPNAQLVDNLLASMQKYNVICVARRNPTGQDVLYFYTRLINDVLALMEITVSGSQVVICVRSKALQVLDDVLLAVREILDKSQQSMQDTPQSLI